MDSQGDLPAVPESRLPGALLARLPTGTPGPPWDCRVRAVVWLQRGRPPLPADSAFAGRTWPLTLGAVVDYLDTPVGPYREVFAGPLLRGALLPGVHVPFIAVDSLPSVQGGRAHWGLPKALAEFTGDVGAGRATATGAGWSVAVDAVACGPRLPLLGRLHDDQGRGRAAIALRGRGRPARVRVVASGPTLTGWLGAGSHPGVLAEGRMRVHEPR